MLLSKHLFCDPFADNGYCASGHLKKNAIKALPLIYKKKYKKSCFIDFIYNKFLGFKIS